MNLFLYLPIKPKRMQYFKKNNESMNPSLFCIEYPWSKPPEFSWLGELFEISPHGGLGTIHTKHRSEAALVGSCVVEIAPADESEDLCF